MSLPASPASRALQVYYGGTFDPVHNAHLAIARAARDGLGASVHLVPAADPPHRARPGAGAADRARMVALAIAGEDGLQLDRCELERARRQPGRPSWTVDTLAELRATVGPDVPLAWVVGGDSLAGLEGWHRWQALFDLAHLVVVERPGSPLPAMLPPALRAVVRGGGWCPDPEGLRAVPAGCLYRLAMPLLEISSTGVRARLAAGQPVDGLVHPDVAAFIARHRLYGVHAG